jgi:hypothetical protein
MTAKNTRYRCISKILEVAKEELNQSWQCTGKKYFPENYNPWKHHQKNLKAISSQIYVAWTKIKYN